MKNSSASATQAARIMKAARGGVLLTLCVAGACSDDSKDSDLSGGQCTTEFKPCGGDLVGTWEYTGACLSELPDLPLEGAAKAFAVCDDEPEIDVSIDLSGEAEFGEDGSFRSEQTAALSGGVRISDGCLAQVGKSMEAADLSCEDIAAKPVAGGCRIEMEEEPGELTATGTYSVSGSELEVVTGGGDSSPATGYCVRGDTLTAEITIAGSSLKVIYRAKRK
jgi:hypothetical protein